MIIVFLDKRLHNVTIGNLALRAEQINALLEQIFNRNAQSLQKPTSAITISSQ